MWTDGERERVRTSGGGHVSAVAAIDATMTAIVATSRAEMIAIATIAESVSGGVIRTARATEGMSGHGSAHGAAALSGRASAVSAIDPRLPLLPALIVDNLHALFKSAQLVTVLSAVKEAIRTDYGHHPRLRYLLGRV